MTIPEDLSQLDEYHPVLAKAIEQAVELLIHAWESIDRSIANQHVNGKDMSWCITWVAPHDDPKKLNAYMCYSEPTTLEVSSEIEDINQPNLPLENE
jgi:hypothetical protein